MTTEESLIYAYEKLNEYHKIIEKLVEENKTLKDLLNKDCKRREQERELGFC